MTINGRRNIVCIVWTIVGFMLVWRGLPYVGLRADPDIVALSGANTWVALAVALVVGIGKGLTALRKGARRAAAHIESRGADAPWWSVFSPVMILLVAVMIAAGLALRYAPYDATVKAWIVGTLYPAIGVALVLGGQFARGARPAPQPWAAAEASD